MIVPPTEGLRVARYAEGAGYSPDQWARALAEVDWSRAELLSDKPRSSVWRATLVVQKRPMAVVIKCEPIDTLKRRVQALLGRTHAHRHWRGARLLGRHGIRAADPKAIVYGRPDGSSIECLIMEAVEGRTLLGVMAGGAGIPERRDVGGAVAAHLVALWRLGVFNRDGKPSNLMVTGGAPASVAELDVVALRRVGWIEESDWALACRNLVLEAIGCGVAPSCATMMRFCRQLHARLGSATRHMPGAGPWREFRDELWGAVGELIEAHGDPTPEHDPLNGSGRLETGSTGGRGAPGA